MFREINQSLLKQDAPPLKKRWFRDYDMEQDLIVWESLQSDLQKFQLWYKGWLLDFEQNRGIRTGKILPSTGAFKNYQSDLFAYHRVADDAILSYIKNLSKDAKIQDEKVQQFLSQVLEDLQTKEED
jgi:hypothetical protein